MKIFGVHIENISRKNLIHFLHDAMHESRFHRIATVNPEFLLLAEKNPSFRKNLAEADIRVADGFGITLAFGLHGETLLERFPGADLLQSVLTLAAAHHYPVFCAVRKDGLSSLEEVKTALQKRFPHIQVTGEEFDPLLLDDETPRVTAPILLSNFGAPEQEFFLARYNTPETAVRLAVGIGGAFDYLTGKVTRSPTWMQFLGLEWLWRLKEQPKRFPRILQATIVFPWKAFSEK